MKSVQKYLDRIGYTRKFEANLDTLQQLHLAQLKSIPYENIDVRLGKAVSLDLDDIFQKVVVNGRGGYCYELNSLFAWLLMEAGFEVHYLSAQILSIYPDGLPGPEFEHMVLKVRAGDNWWLVDVGHGEVFEMPMPLISGIEQTEETGTFRLLHLENNWVIYKQIHSGEEWKPMYQFSTVSRDRNEFFPRHLWNQSHDSTVYKNLTLVVKSFGGGCRILINDRLKTWQGRMFSEEMISEDQYINVLSEKFDISLPQNTPVKVLLSPDRHKETCYGRAEYEQFLKIERTDLNDC